MRYMSLGMTIVLAGSVSAQSLQPEPFTDAKFEAASVKLNRSGTGSFSAQTLPDRTIFINYKLANLVAVAHQVRADDVLNAPEWVANERFDINAKIAESDTQGTAAEVRMRRQAMLRNLLRDRFGLIVREGTVEKDSFALVVARSDGRLGTQLRPSSLTCGDNVKLPPAEIRQGQSALPA